MPPLAGILFDLDGTLTHTDPQHFQAWKAVLVDYGLMIDLPFYQQHFCGRTNAEIMRDILPDLSPAAGAAIAAEKERQFRITSPTLERLPGLDRVLTEFAALPRGVVTNAPADNAAHMLQALGLMTATTHTFQTVVLAEEVAQGKPAPDPYLEGLRRLGLSAAATIAFEDTPTGVRAAVAAGITTIGIATTYPTAALRSAGASLTIADFTDVALWDWLERWAYCP